MFFYCCCASIITVNKDLHKDFYRATRMHSAVYALVRCPSVSLSVTLVYCVETTALIVIHLSERDVVIFHEPYKVETKLV